MRNIFLIVVDCLRADFAHSHYLPFHHGSIVYRNCWATAGATVPGMHSILTGLLPSEHGGIYEDVRPTAPTVLDMMREQGYNVLAVTENPLTRWLGQYFPSYQPLEEEGQYVTPGVGIDFIKDNLPRPPYFVLYHYMRVHHPYIAHPAYEDGTAIEPRELNRRERPCTLQIVQQFREAYGRGVVESAHRIWELYQYHRNAVFIITADHGEAFWEHGFMTHIADRMVPELLHVPLIVADRCGGEPQYEWVPVSTADVPEIALQAGHGGRYVPRRPWVRAEDYKEPPSPIAAVRMGSWVGVAREDTHRYYSLDDDPGMHRPIEEPPPGVAKRLARHLKIREVTGQYISIDDDPEVTERLRDLGYLD